MADACCDPIMDLGALHRRQRRALIVVLSINIVTFAMMVYAAYASRSTSLLSGGLDNFGDALTYALSLAVVGSTLAAQSRVAMVKGLLIASAAVAVLAQIVWRLLDPTTPVFETMGTFGVLNLAANGVCLAILTTYRHGDVNMASAWECSRNDILEGTAVLAAAAGVYVFDAGWPDLAVAIALLALFARSAWRVLREARKGLRPAALVTDPVCGCKVDPATSISSTHGGSTHYFCDPGCRQTFESQGGPRPQP